VQASCWCRWPATSATRGASISREVHPGREGQRRLLDALLLILTIAAIVLSLWDRATDWLGLTVLSLFMLCFLLRWRIAADRGAFLKANWLDVALVVLLASPLLRIFTLMRVAPLLRIGTMIRANRRHLIRLVVISQESFPAAMSVLFAVVFVFGISAWLLEHGHNPAFAHVSDGLWWAFATLTTVGYGDVYPVTDGGRIVAVFTMIFGITVYSLMIANITLFVQRIGSRHGDKAPRPDDEA